MVIIKISEHNLLLNEYDVEDPKIRDYIMNKFDTSDYTHYVFRNCYQWYSIYCDINKRWYTTDEFKNPDLYIKTDIEPTFFGGHAIYIYKEVGKSFLTPHMPIGYGTIKTNAIVLNGELIMSGSHCYYKNTDTGVYEIAHESDMRFHPLYTKISNKPLKIDEICAEFECYGVLLVIKYNDEYYISHSNVSDYFYGIPRLPDDYVDAGCLYFMYS